MRVIKLYTALPKTTEAQVIAKQVSRSGTSVGAHYRESCRAKSNADFISKIEGALQELGETCYWLELVCEAQIFNQERTQPLLAEAEELIKILVTIVKQVKSQR